MADLFTLQSGEIERHEARIRTLLAKVDKADWSVDQVIADLKDAKAQCWGIANPSIEGVWITRIENTAKARFGLVWIAAGTGLSHGVTWFIACTEPWFREQGCEYIEIQGRKGWAQALPGFEIHSYVLRKPLWAAADHQAIQRPQRDKNLLLM